MASMTDSASASEYAPSGLSNPMATAASPKNFRQPLAALYVQVFIPEKCLV